MVADGFVAVDVETANSFLGSICQIAAVRYRSGEEAAFFSSLINPRDLFDPFNVSIHGIDEDAVRGMPIFGEIWNELKDFIGGDMVASHTLFDRASVRQACAVADIPMPSWVWLNTVRVARRVWRLDSHGLAHLASHLGIALRHHDALEDARAAGKVLLRAVAESGISLADWPARVEKPIAGIDSSRIRLAGSEQGPLAGECVVFTGDAGITRAELAARANALGAAIDPGVTSRTTILVVGDQDLRKLNGRTTSSKQRKAQAMIEQGAALRIIAASDFVAL